MNRRSLIRLVSLTLVWLIAASVFVAAPRAEASTVDALPQMVAGLGVESPTSIAAAPSSAGLGTSSFGAASSLLAAAQWATPCTYTDPDTGIDHDGTLEVREVGGDHNDYDNDGNFNDQDDKVVAVFERDNATILQTNPGYRYQLDVCVSNVWPYEPLEANWHGDPYKLVLAENAAEWFATVRDAAYEEAFRDKVPGWQVWPDRAHMQIVGLDSWLYIENFYGDLDGSHKLNESEGDEISVQVRAVPKKSEWWIYQTAIKKEETFDCYAGAGRGAAWSPGAPKGPNDKCSLSWNHSSSIIGEVEVRVRLIYDVTISSTTLNNDDANDDAGQVFSQFIPDVAGEWDVAEDGDVPDDYKLYVSEVLTNGVDPSGEVTAPEPKAALGATPGGPQVGVDDGCWGPDVVCRVVVAVGGAVLDFIIPEEVRALVKGCWDGAKNAAIGFGELLSNLNPTTWDDKIAEMNALKDTLLEAHENGELLDVLTDMGLAAGFDSLRLDIFDTVGDGNFGDLDFSDTVKWGEWIGAVGCEYLIGLFTGKAQERINDLLFNTRNRNNRNDDEEDGTKTEDEEGTGPEEDEGPIVCVNALGPDSFLTGTQVLMADGSHRAIDQIEPGDRVLSYETATTEWRAQVVTHQWSAIDQGHMSTVTIQDGSTMDATDHHLFWVESDLAWTAISDLVAGDTLLTPDGEVAVATSTTGPATQTLVWELSVAGDHNFTVLAGDHNLLVHNKDPDCGDGPDGPDAPRDRGEAVSETWDEWENKTTIYEDGTIEITRSDGTSVTTFPEGGGIHVDRNGNTFSTDADGSFSFVDADGNDVALHLPDGNPVVDSTGAPIAEMTGNTDNPQGIDEAWLDEFGNERYPPNNGTVDGEEISFVQQGDQLDRYGEPGKPNGSYLGEEGVPLEDRGIAPLADGQPKELFPYESQVGTDVPGADGVLHEVPPMPVYEGEIAPWNGSPGGETQFRTDPGLIADTYGPGSPGGEHPLFDQMLNDAGYPNNEFWFGVEG